MNDQHGRVGAAFFGTGQIAEHGKRWRWRILPGRPSMRGSLGSTVTPVSEGGTSVGVAEGVVEGVWGPHPKLPSKVVPTTTPPVTSASRPDELPAVYPFARANSPAGYLSSRPVDRPSSNYLRHYWLYFQLPISGRSRLSPNPPKGSSRAGPGQGMRGESKRR